ncbi:hypothetical protein [Bradyrhizobium viridifuturi]|uniref:hypothetical protein n=1 Tax=Bradyrhizobium viridifuturi TaxID=1654716 RepID=UPI000FE14927|nr:hypothetical protein [Bradyrhizobium viridifuturi]
MIVEVRSTHIELSPRASMALAEKLLRSGAKAMVLEEMLGEAAVAPAPASRRGPAVTTRKAGKK